MVKQAPGSDAKSKMDVSITQATLEATEILTRAGVPEARREAGSLLTFTLGRDRGFIITHADESVSGNDLERFRQLVERRAAGEPLQYLTGHQQFFNLDFEVTPDVLIPRPETELLVELTLDLLKVTADQTIICDVGTGSGCVAISILKNSPKARAVATDISLAALQVAQRNATRHGVIDRLALVASDCFSAFIDAKPFTMIVSNPPYVADNELGKLQREVREREPRLALSAGWDGLSIIRRLLADAPLFLRSAGHLLFEIGFDQREAVERLLDKRLWKLLGIHHDLQGIPRTVVLQKT